MELSHEIYKGLPPVTVLNVVGAVDGSNYTQLIEYASTLISGGTEYLLLDLKGCNFLSSSGLFALHSIALLAHKTPPLDPGQGWQSLHKMTSEEHQFKERFKIAHLQPNVARTLDLAGLSTVFDIYSDLPEALAVFRKTNSKYG